MRFEQQFDEDTKTYGIGGSASEFWKPTEGANKLRILATPMITVSRYKFGVCYEGAEYCKKENLLPKEALSYKWLTWIIDRADGNQKLYNIPFSVTKMITSLKTNEEYFFEDFPMPYDITLNVNGAGTKEVKYSVVPSRKESPITAEENELFSTQTSVEDVIAAMKEKARKAHGGEGNSISEVEKRSNKIAYEVADDYPEEESIKAQDIPF